MCDAQAILREFKKIFNEIPGYPLQSNDRIRIRMINGAGEARRTTAENEQG